MSRKKTQAERLRDGDTRKIGANKLAAAIAAEPRVENGLPEVSPRLAGDAASIYSFYVQQLSQSGLAAMPDVYALERACVALATCWRADRALQREGAVIRTPIMTGRGRARKRVGWHQTRNKWFAVRLESEKAFRLFANQFGLTGPVSRAGLEVQHPGPSIRNAKLWELLSRPRPPKPDPPEPGKEASPLPSEPVQ